MSYEYKNASMRPRQVCRGNPCSSRPRIRGSRRFNEAPASLPGKPRPLRDEPPPDPGFNEAPASLPGKRVYEA